MEFLLDVLSFPIPLDDFSGTSKKLVNFMLPTYKVGTEDKQGALHLLAITSESMW